jgi:hypothetical protein
MSKLQRSDITIAPEERHCKFDIIIIAQSKNENYLKV